MMTASHFYGEFGWEVSMWAPYLRARKVNRVHCLPGHQGLYKFAQEVIIEPHAITNVTHDCQHGYVNGKRIQRSVYGPGSWITPYDLPVQTMIENAGCPVVVKASFAPLNEQVCTDGDYTLVIHARDHVQHDERNWSLGNWHEFLHYVREDSMIERVVALGRKPGSAKPLGTEDLRNTPITVQADHCAGRIIVGPSSGPMCIALSSNPKGIVTWSGNKKDVDRFTSLWNPFGVPCRVIESWQPSPREVFNEFESLSKSPTGL